MFHTYEIKKTTVEAVRFDEPPKRMGVSDVFEYMGESFTCGSRLPCVGDYFVKGEGFVPKDKFNQKYRKVDA